MCQYLVRVHGREAGQLTVVASWDATASLPVGGGAGVLLEVGLGNTASATRDRAVLVLAGRDSWVLGGGSDNTGEGQEDGGERELHLEISAEGMETLEEMKR